MSEADSPRFLRPKVMLIDLPDEAASKVKAAGYSVVEGTLGRPYRVTPNDTYSPIKPNGRVPGIAEQEVVVVQMRPQEPVPITPSDLKEVASKATIWGHQADGVVDPRGWVANAMADNVNRILEHGGVAVMYCAAPRRSGLVRATAPERGRYGGGLGVECELDWSPWSLVPQTANLQVGYDHGEEITPAAIEFDVLASHLRSATFECTIEAPSYLEKRWFSAATNKYGKSVAGLLTVERGEDPPGWVVLLPQVRDLGGCTVELLQHVLPVLARAVFPESDNTAWLRSETYELPAVAELNSQIAAVREEAASREAELGVQVEQQRQQDGWLHELLTATGDDLVVAVERSLVELGLQDVRRVDDEEEEQKTGRRREDLQVWGQSPVVLVEVKGITNLPRETNSLQVTKYLVPRMRQWARNDVRGLSIINQQRGLPALDRDNINTFQQDVLDNATDQGFGLLTALDMFRLLRNKRRWGWPDEVVAPLLYGDGRIAPIPTHYARVGVVDGFFEKAGVLTLTVTDRGFEVGEELAFALPMDYEQQLVESIQFDDAAVQRAEPGQRVGVKTHLTKAQARKGVEVYCVDRFET